MVDAIRVLDSGPLGLAREALLLNTSDVEHICLGEDIFNTFALMNRDACTTGGVDDGCRHCQGCWGHEVQADTVHAQEGHETVHSTAVLEITEECDCPPVDRTQFGADCIDVK